jgi:hypothetical protein
VSIVEADKAIGSSDIRGGRGGFLGKGSSGVRGGSLGSSGI